MTIKEIKKLINLADYSRLKINWQTSYHYQTKTSAKRGGYNRTRTTQYWWNGSILRKIDDIRIDNLTGDVVELNDYGCVYSVPIPSVFMENAEYEFSVMSSGRFKEEKPVKELKYCLFMGTRESAEYLASFNPSLPLLEGYKVGDVESYSVTFDLFFPEKERAKHFKPFHVAEINDGIPSEIEKIILPAKNSHLSLVRDKTLFACVSN